ncbi:MAG TPA: DUF2889 domain-containing protein [Casimicrobiaceae bacterium]|nr:DUF2889 domain-containing protein [Casimicrobiaceae bacterium]
MPLAPLPVKRARLHTRKVAYEAFRRDDGLFDIEGHLTDVKDHDYALLTGLRPAGVPVHDMWVRVTVGPDYLIRALEVKTDEMPYPGACNRIEGAYAKLVGASLLHGFRKALYDAMGGVRGCSHVTELLAHLPTAAIQMFAGLRREIGEDGSRPFQLDRCHALETTTDTVRRYYPQWYRRSVNEAGMDVVPAQAGTQSRQAVRTAGKNLGPGLRRGDEDSS